MGVSAAQGSAGLKPGVCTSTTRPSNPFEGQMIYETDTNLSLLYNGSGWVTLTPQSATTVAQLTVTNTSFATGTPAVSVLTGTTALITLSARIQNQPGQAGRMAVAVSGATTIAAIADNEIYSAGQASEGMVLSLGRTFLLSGLTAGTNTFTCWYNTSVGTSYFSNRSITVVGIP